MTSPLPANPVARWLLILILAAGVYFFHGFLVPVLAALIIGFASWPLYKRLVRACGGRTPIRSDHWRAVRILAKNTHIVESTSNSWERTEKV
jgi:hypothetical protein